MLSSPRVLCKHRPDSTSLESLLSFSKFKGKTGEELVLAIYDYFTDQTNGFYHFWPSDEKYGHPQKNSTISDSIKLLNVYGWTICGQSSSFLNNLYHKAGLKSRIFSIPGHVLCEVYYDNQWHVLDVDMWTWFKKEDNQIASAYDLVTNADALILNNTNTSSPCNLPDRELSGYAELYKKTKTIENEVYNIFPDTKQFGFSISYNLRPGEKITRSEFESGYFQIPDTWLKNILEGSAEWKGKPCERFAPFRTYGNGTIEYKPNLTVESSDLKNSGWQINRLKQTNEGVEGIGSLYFNINSPYPITGKPTIENEKVFYHDAAYLKLTGSGGIKVEISDKEGRMITKTILRDSFDETIDLTEELQGRYKGIIKLSFIDRSILSSLKYFAHFQHAPITMPKLEIGNNEMMLNTADKKGYHTIAQRTIVDFRNLKGLNKHLVTVLDGYMNSDESGWFRISPKDPQQPAVSIFCIKSQNPMKWFYCFAAIKEDLKQIEGEIAWSLNKNDWQPLAKETFVKSRMNWDVHVNAEHVLEKAVKKIYIKITSNCSLSKFELISHEIIKHPAKELQITHEWEENGNKQNFSAYFKRNAFYQVPIQHKPENHILTIEAPSQGLNTAKPSKLSNLNTREMSEVNQ